MTESNQDGSTTPQTHNDAAPAETAVAMPQNHQSPIAPPAEQTVTEPPPTVEPSTPAVETPELPSVDTGISDQTTISEAPPMAPLATVPEPQTLPEAVPRHVTKPGIRIGVIGGSGLAQELGAQTSGIRHEVDTPFGKPSDVIIETEWAGIPIFVISRHGPGHLLNPSHVPFRANIFALKKLGVTHIIASGAVGSLREEFKPRDLVIADQVIDKTHKRANTFYDKAAVHCEFAEPFCPVLRQILLEAGSKIGQLADADRHPFSVHDRGCYVAMEGPAFSTRAESLMHRLWGGDLIGMTAMPEAKLAKEAEISYALIALVTDYDCWRLQPPGKRPAGEHPTIDSKPVEKPDPSALLKEIIGHLQAATHNAIELIRRAVDLMAQRREELADCPAQHALQLAIWSDRSKIDRAEVQRLAPLWMKYFE